MSIITCRSHLSRGVPQLLRVRPAETLFNYIGGTSGEWQITNAVTHSGTSLKAASHITIANGRLDRMPVGAAWMLRGIVNNTRYVTREEPSQPSSISPNATCAALIPIRKSAAWWSLGQEERQEILEARSHDVTTGWNALPAIARRLQLSRDLGEPFDFVTWFEYSPEDEPIFDNLANALRNSKEWQYVEREIDIRLIRSR